MEQKWAPRDMPVFQLVPPAFEKQAIALYNCLKTPVVCFQTFWDVYGQLLTSFWALPLGAFLIKALENADCDMEVEVPLIPGLRDLRYGDTAVGELGFVYYGGLNNLFAITDTDEEEEVEDDLREYADFSD